MEHTINNMLQAKDVLSQQISTLLNEFVDTYDVTDVSLDVNTYHNVGQRKCALVQAEVTIEY